MPLSARILAALAALLGAAGVAAAAAAAHGGYGENLRTASEFALIHAALVIALVVRSPRPGLAIPAAVVLAGALLFCGDLTMRAIASRGLFPMAAPSGGFLMIAGWLLIAASALLPRSK